MIARLSPDQEKYLKPWKSKEEDEHSEETPKIQSLFLEFRPMKRLRRKMKLSPRSSPKQSKKRLKL